jgi:hypothetical protein
MYKSSGGLTDVYSPPPLRGLTLRWPIRPRLALRSTRGYMPSPTSGACTACVLRGSVRPAPFAGLCGWGDTFVDLARPPSGSTRHDRSRPANRARRSPPRMPGGAGDDHRRSRPPLCGARLEGTCSARGGQAREPLNVKLRLTKSPIKKLRRCLVDSAAGAMGDRLLGADSESLPRQFMGGAFVL